MKAPDNPPIDRFLIAALVDRLIYDSEDVFDPEDAPALPHRKSPRFEFGIAGRFKGGSTKGYAAGVGDVKLDDKNNSDFTYSNAKDAYTRAGQWKLIWAGGRRGQTIEIEQVMSDPFEAGRGARLHFDLDGTPNAMDIRFVRAFTFFFITVMLPGWKPWKKPGKAAEVS